MNFKHFIAALLLSLTATAALQAQVNKAMPIFGDTGNVKNTEQTDTLKQLSDEMDRLKSQINANEAQALQEKVWKRRKYWKLGFNFPTIERTDGAEMQWKTDIAVSIVRGKTAYLHSKPIAGMVKFGIDYGFMDLSYAKLKFKNAGYANSPVLPSNPDTGDGFGNIVGDEPSGSVGDVMDVNLGMHKFEYGMHVGPSINVNPWDHLILSAYFHLNPTASGILENSNFSYGFGLAMSAGFSVSYKAVSVGVEGLWSKIKYTQASFDEYDDNNIFTTKKFKLKQKGPRVYVALKF